MTEMDPAATTSAGAGGQPARLPTSLLDLPDELIKRIFQLLHESFQPPPHDVWYYRSPAIPSTDYLTVSKRVHRIALPTWTSRISCAADENDRRLTALYLGKTNYDRVSHYGVALKDAYCHLQLVVATSFRRLERLNIDLSKLRSTVDIVPALRRLTQLKRLSLFWGGPLHVDSTFRLSELPRLEHLTTPANDWSFALLQGGTGNLLSATLVSLTSPAVPPSFPVPWNVSTLFLTSISDKSAYPDLVATCRHTLRFVPPSSLVLQHLSIDAHVLDEKKTWEELETILDLLSNSSLRRLELSYLPRFAPIRADKRVARLSSVIRLKLHFAYRSTAYLTSKPIDRDLELSRLLRFVAAFPQLRQLDVDELYSVLEGDPALFQTAKRAISAIASLDNLAEHAVSLAALLFQLEAGTCVTRFGLREPDTGDETRFTRQGNGDKFEMEQWKGY